MPLCGYRPRAASLDVHWILERPAAEGLYHRASRSPTSLGLVSNVAYLIKS